MRTNGTGGQTTVSWAGGTVNISTTNLLDYRRLLRRLGAGAITANDSTHAVFSYARSNATLHLRALRALEAPERHALKSLTPSELVKGATLLFTGFAPRITVA